LRRLEWHTSCDEKFVYAGETALQSLEITTIRSAGLALLAATALAAPALAAPVSFSVSPGGIRAGSGYGVDADEATGTLLDVVFASAGSALWSATLEVGQSFGFEIGTVTLRETDIAAAETDGLGVQALLTFFDPMVGQQTVAATGTATVGGVGDPQQDYRLQWATQTVGFGVGGQFTLGVNTTNFSAVGETRVLNATLTLTTAPAAARVAHVVPEPAGLVLAGSALLAAAAASRRRRRRA
jgi:hypothetical protein